MPKVRINLIYSLLLSTIIVTWTCKMVFPSPQLLDDAVVYIWQFLWLCLLVSQPIPFAFQNSFCLYYLNYPLQALVHHLAWDYRLAKYDFRDFLVYLSLQKVEIWSRLNLKSHIDKPLCYLSSGSFCSFWLCHTLV